MLGLPKSLLKKKGVIIKKKKKKKYTHTKTKQKREKEKGCVHERHFFALYKTEFHLKVLVPK